MTARLQSSVPFPAGLLGFAGALPFIALAALSFYDNINVSLQSIAILRLYGALILSFLGGVHWGLALAAPKLGRTASWRRYAASVVPTLWGWGAMLVSTFNGLIALALGFALLLGYDLFSVRRAEAPLWYPRLRIPLTAIALAALAMAAYRY